VEFDVDVNDNDMGFLLGKHFIEHAVDTFDLGDIDPNSIRIENSCEPFETPTGQATGLNCDDEQGKFVIFQAANAKPKPHEERTGASWKSRYHSKEGKHEKLTDQLCKSMPNNGAYCDEPERKMAPVLDLHPVRVQHAGVRQAVCQSIQTCCNAMRWKTIDLLRSRYFCGE
jgi:hypothetical protein